jgi:hypothetical protein
MYNKLITNGFFLKFLKGGIMLLRSLLLLAVFSAGCLFAETVQKSSTQFYFPTTVGVRNGKTVAMTGVQFGAVVRNKATNTIAFSWKFPASKTTRGTITLHSLAGAVIKVIPIESSNGTATTTFGNGKIAAGLYFAALSFGGVSQTCNFIVY